MIRLDCGLLFQLFQLISRVSYLKLRGINAVHLVSRHHSTIKSANHSWKTPSIQTTFLFVKLKLNKNNQIKNLVFQHWLKNYDLIQIVRNKWKLVRVKTEDRVYPTPISALVLQVSLVKIANTKLTHAGILHF